MANILYTNQAVDSKETFVTPLGNEVLISLLDGIKVSVMWNTDAELHIRFIDLDTDIVEYETTIVREVDWTAPNNKYYVNWHVEVFENNLLVIDYKLNLKNKTVLINVCSNALGDTVAWMPFIEEFRKKHECRIIASTFWNSLFKDNYPKIQFAEPNTDIAYDASYQVGVYDNNYSRNKNNWRLIPIQQVASDALGFPKHEIRADVVVPNQERVIKKKYVCFSEHATFYAKYWSYPGGWQTVINALREKGYEVVSVSKEVSNLDNIIKFNNLPIETIAHTLKHADFYIGTSSGLSVLAWSLGIPTIIISGFGSKNREMFDKCYRVINENVCHACSDDKDLPIDRGNWKWCPRNCNFICSRAITPEMVLNIVDQLLMDKA